MAEEYDVQAIMNALREKEEMDPDQHDGSYELMRETIRVYGKLDDFSTIDFKDLNLVYLTSVGTWKQGIGSKKKTVNDSHLMTEDKEYLTKLWDEVWEKAGRKEYTNYEKGVADDRSIGLFGTGFFSFQRTTTNAHAQAFIKMCVDILPMTDDNAMYDRASEVLTKSFKGMKAASASMVLHCLKPFSFPVLNSNMGNRNIFEVLGVDLVKKDNLETYIDNCRKVKAFRDKNFSCKNYRIFDIAAWKVKEYEIEGSIEAPEPKRAWLVTWNRNGYEWEDYEKDCERIQAGHSLTLSWTCNSTKPAIGDEVFMFKLGDRPRGIIGHGTVVHESYVAEHYDPEKARRGERAKYIDIKFNCLLNYEKGEILSQEKLNNSCPEQLWSPQGSGIVIKDEVLPKLHRLWKEITEPDVNDRYRSSPEEYPLNVSKDEWNHNLILYGPPGTGKTYNSVIYAVSICEKKPVEEVGKEQYRDVLIRFNELRDAGRIKFTTFHQSYGYEEFIEGIKPKLDTDNEALGYSIEDGIFKAFCDKARNNKETKPYVFIIDEINRGNISKIFGELITLIEDTKRAGATEAMEATLPYSGEAFSVPENVYILGTMNTADRSIALMDTALRRRFEFEEMMPDSEVLVSWGVGTIVVGDVELNVAKMLDVINERIEYLFDREHTIGHAFFRRLADNPSIETLAGIFEKNVIPLLQEYFYEDYEKIQLILGDNSKEDEYKFILDRSVKVKDIFNGNPDIDLPEKGYSVQHSAFLKLESYKQIGKDL